MRLEDEMVGEKKPSRDTKSSRDEPNGTRKDQWLEAIRDLTNIINGQSKMIKAQGAKLQELEANVTRNGQLEQANDNIV